MLAAVDIGNTRLKVGLFPRAPSERIEPPLAVEAVRHDEEPFDRLVEWLDQQVEGGLTAIPQWEISQVRRPVADRFIEWLTDHHPEAAWRLVTAKEIAIDVDMEDPSGVGSDRLLSASVAVQLRAGERPAVVVDFGSALTINLLDRDGSFRGGAILPGVQTSIDSLAKLTDRLPAWPAGKLVVPPSMWGESTTASLEAGAFWGTIGSIREFLTQWSRVLEDEPEVFFTGGHAEPFVSALAPKHVLYRPSMVLEGLKLAADQAASRG